MKVTCTARQKELLIKAMARLYDCVFTKDEKQCDSDVYCAECIEKTVEWQIEDGDGDG